MHSQHACICNLQVLTLLAEDCAWMYSTPQVAMCAACAGLYLIDLLHMRWLPYSPMALTEPEDFLQACCGAVADQFSNFTVPTKKW